MAVKIELVPSDGQKSFYGKAYIMVDAKAQTETLYSYDTPIIRKQGNRYTRLWNDWSATTGRHIKAFCGMNKAQFLKLPMD